MQYIYINNVKYKFVGFYTIYQYCSEQNVTIPCFCYHGKPKIAGNRRMCLVQIDVRTNSVVSCITTMVHGMNAYTGNERVIFARENIMEYLLLNHPLDCPICDQGGECDSQDVSKALGYIINRICVNKRIVYNLDSFSPMVKTLMTRCIHCTRCVRYIDSINGLGKFNSVGRGKKMYIYSNIYPFLLNELSSNIIDLCPVGALVQMPRAFEARS
jgi:NADH-quinone oxidoreductase subunit G